MNNIIECVPNFSEGRDPSRIAELIAAMSGVAGAAVLDCHSDADHNRTVITLAGEPEAVAEAALRGIGKAAELIDLTRHAGVHPRMGATDVLPFVPIQGWNIDQCATLAHRVGREIWERYRIPVYFYGAAAKQADREPLENIRRGQFEGLRSAVLTGPAREPDIGGPCLHPTAGAVAVGARHFLIACNVNLRTTDVEIAGKIARAIRASSGGLPCVKAIGLPLKSRGLVQVSMNLTDFSATPLPHLFRRVREEAEKYGCAIADTEIVGLVPRQALLDADPINVLPSQILENRIAALLPSALAMETMSNDQQSQGISSRGVGR